MGKGDRTKNKKDYLLIGIIIVVVVVVVSAAAALLANTGDDIYSQLKDADIYIEVEGAQLAELTADDFLKLPLVEQKITKENDTGNEETLTLKGFLFNELLQYLGIDYYKFVKLTSADENTVFATGGLFAVSLSGELLPPDKGPIWYIGNKYAEHMWLPNVTKITVDTTTGGMVFITGGPQELETASRIAGFKVASLTGLPAEYIRAQTYIHSHSFGNVVTQIWIAADKNITITLAEYETKPPEYQFPFAGEPTEINGLPGYKYLLDPEKNVPEDWANYWASKEDIPTLLELRWPQGERYYQLSVTFPATVDEKWVYELAAAVK